MKMLPVLNRIIISKRDVEFELASKVKVKLNLAFHAGARYAFWPQIENPYEESYSDVRFT